MKKFSDYVTIRDRFELCSSLVENNVDVEAMCNHIKSVVDVVGKLDEADLQLEFMSGLKAGLAGLGGAAGYGVGAGARVGGNIAGAGLDMAKRAGSAIMNKVGQYGGAVKQAGQQFAQNAKDAGMQAYQASRITDAMKRVGDLEKFLIQQKMGDPAVIGQQFQSLRQQLSQMNNHNKANFGARLGQPGMSMA